VFCTCKSLCKIVVHSFFMDFSMSPFLSFHWKKRLGEKDRKGRKMKTFLTRRETCKYKVNGEARSGDN
jgi:hypothetical protein